MSGPLFYLCQHLRTRVKFNHNAVVESGDYPHCHQQDSSLGRSRIGSGTWKFFTLASFTRPRQLRHQQRSPSVRRLALKHHRLESLQQRQQIRSAGAGRK